VFGNILHLLMLCDNHAHAHVRDNVFEKIRFTAIMCGDHDRIVPGHALAMQSDKPFQGLSNFGNSFLTKFEGAEVSQSSFLGNVTLIDTPGVLSGEKQRIGRDYDFTAVMNWCVVCVCVCICSL
jgi:hypothetical protein